MVISSVSGLLRRSLKSIFDENADVYETIYVLTFNELLSTCF